MTRWEGENHSNPKHKLKLTVHEDTLGQRKATLNLNVNRNVQDVHLFPRITSAFLFRVSRQSYRTHSPLLSESNKRERTAEKQKLKIELFLLSELLESAFRGTQLRGNKSFHFSHRHVALGQKAV